MKFETVVFGDLAKFRYGRMPNKKKITVSGKYPIFSGYRITGYYDDYNLEKDEIIIVARGVGGTGDVKLSPQKCYLTNLSIAVEMNENIVIKKYLYYYFQIRNLKYLDSGSAQSQITISDLEKVEINVPAINIQKQIVEILESIDDKIKINTAINENLEQQMGALCEKWASEHLASITMLPLAEISEINSDTYSSKDKWEYINYLDTSSITNGVMSEIQMIRPNEEKLPSRARRIIKAGDIVYSTVRPNQLHFGIISNPLKNMLASTGFAVIRSKYSYISSPYIYHFLTSPDFIEKMQQLAEQSASTFPSVKPSDIGTCLIPCADSEKMQSITETIKDIYEMVSANYQENQRLAALRDTLLPKLMNGEIDISKVQI